MQPIVMDLTVTIKYAITKWRRVLPEKLIVSWLVKNSHHFVEPEGSLHCSQEPTTSPCSKPDETIPNPPILFLQDLF
jgi:hypothetical protein